MLIHDLETIDSPSPDARLLGSHKRIKNLLAHFRRDSRSSILQPHLNSMAPVRARDRSLHPESPTFAAHGLIRILHEIQEHLLAKILVERHRGKSF